MESGLIFNQLICEFESRHPCQIIADCPLQAQSLVTRSAIGDRKLTIFLGA
jgi:hypothetical protein